MEWLNDYFTLLKLSLWIYIHDVKWLDSVLFIIYHNFKCQN